MMYSPCHFICAGSTSGNSAHAFEAKNGRMD